MQVLENLHQEQIEVLALASLKAARSFVVSKFNGKGRAQFVEHGPVVFVQIGDGSGRGLRHIFQWFVRHGLLIQDDE